MSVGTLKLVEIISTAFEIRVVQDKKGFGDWDDAVLTARWVDLLLFQICQKACGGRPNACKVKKSVDHNGSENFENHVGDQNKSYRFIG